MKVIIVSATDLDNIRASGTDSYVKALLQNIRSQGVDIILMGMGDEKSEEIIPVVKTTNHTYRYLSGLFLKSLFTKIPKDAIIHAQRADFLVPFILFRRGGNRVVTLHGPASRSIRLRKGHFVGCIYNLMERYAVNRADAIIAVSEVNKALFLERYPHLADRVVVIPVGVDTDIFHPMDNGELRAKHGFGEGDDVLLYVGRFSREKRMNWLPRIFREVKEKSPNVVLALVGSGSDKPKMVKGMIDLGPRSKQEVAELMNCADVLLLCSKFEGLPTVVLEALACGLPVVSTAVGDVPILVKDGKTGYATNDLRVLPELVVKALNTKQTLKDECVKTASLYSWDRITKKILSMYRGLSKREK